MRSSLAGLVLSIFLHTNILSPAPAADSAPSWQLNSANICKLVRESDLLDGEYKQQVYAAVQDGVVSISLFRHPEATKADCKIDAVLLTRRIMEAGKSVPKLLRCVFYDFDHQNEYWSVEVRPQLVTAFGAGKISESDLIKSVLLLEDKQNNPLSEKFASLSYSSIVELDSVCKGAQNEKRLALHLRLEDLSKQNLQTPALQEEFLRIEDAARRGENKELPSRIESLEKSLDKYVKQLVQSGRIQDPELRHSKNSLSSATSQSRKDRN